MAKDVRKNLSPILGDFLKELRKKESLSQTELSKELNVTQTSVTHYEKASRMPSVSILRKYSDIFKVDLKKLNELRYQTILETIIQYKENTPKSLLNEFDMAEFNKDDYTNEKLQQIKEILEELNLMGQLSNPYKNNHGVKLRDSLLVDGIPASLEELQYAKEAIRKLRTSKL